MRRLALSLVCVLALAAMTVMTASAASPHFKRRGTPTCADTGTQLVCSGALAGLGNEDLKITLDADALGTFACVNPSGSNEPAGQNKVPFEVGSETIIPSDEIKNGTLSFSIAAPLTPPTATAEQAGCPNPNWSTRLTGLDFANITLTIEQPIGTVIFTCTASAPGQLTC